MILLAHPAILCAIALVWRFVRRAPQAAREAYRENRTEAWRIVIVSVALAVIVAALAHAG